MKKLLILVLTAVFIFSCTSLLLASDNASFNIDVTITQAISITTDSNLSFGSVVQGSSSTTVAPGDTNAASFTVAGVDGAGYTVTLPTSVTLSDGTNNLTVDAFSASNSGSGTLTSGSDSFSVGATLESIGSSQATGSYSGAGTVTVTYSS